VTTMARILTFLQFQALYQLGEKSARKLLYSGDIAGIRTGAGWRIVDPGPELLQLMRMEAADLAEIPFIRGVEAATLLNISSRRLRQLAERGQIKYRLHGARRIYSLQSLLDYIAWRGRVRSQSEGYIRPQVMVWAKSMLRQTLNERGVVLPDFLRDVRSENSDKPAV
jgi:hypothetical protein